MDGVVVDTINFVAKELSEYFKREVKPDEVAHNLGRIEKINDVFEARGEHLLCSLNPMDYAVDAINKIAQEHDVFIISARFQMHYDITLEWLKKHGIYVKEVLFTEGKSKTQICKKKNIDIFVEDSVTNAIELANMGIKVILYSNEYNACLVRKDILRCHTWTSIEETISKIAIGQPI